MSSQVAVATRHTVAMPTGQRQARRRGVCASMVSGGEAAITLFCILFRSPPWMPSRPNLHLPRAFHQSVTPAGFERAIAVHSARRPTNFYVVHSTGLADTHERTRIGCRAVAAATLAEADQPAVADGHCHTGPDSVPVTLCTLQFQTDPVVGRARLVVKQHRGFAAIVDGEVHSAIVVIVTRRQTPANVALLKIRTRDPRNVLEVSPPVVEVELGRLAKGVVGVTILIHMG